MTAVDISPAAIATARSRYAGIEFLEGSVDQLHEGRHFDFVVTADVLAHVPDQQRMLDAIGAALKPRGLLVLMTQNPFVWSRSSHLEPRAPGQIRNWPSLRRLRNMLARQFNVRHVTSIVPHGDRGILRLTNSAFLTANAKRLLGMRASQALFERLMLGMDLVIVAERRIDSAQ